MSLINRAFLKQIIVEEDINIKIKRIASLIKIRGLDTKEYNAYEYIVIPIYIPDKNNKIILIRRKIYIIDNLSTKALININIIKLEDIILDTSKDITVISSYNSLYISISIVIKGLYIDAVVISKARYIVPTYSFITVPIEPIDLS